MRLPLTDQLLWLIYNCGEEVLEPLEIFRLRTREDIIPLGRDIWKALERQKRKRQFAQFVNYLKKQGYIKIASLKGKKGILITPKGSKKILKVKYKLSDKKRRKDKKWIMIMYDIPEKKKKERTSLREMLQILGYQQFQKSIWMCPYDVFKETEEIIRIYSLSPYVKTFLIEEVEL